MLKTPLSLSHCLHLPSPHGPPSNFIMLRNIGPGQEHRHVHCCCSISRWIKGDHTSVIVQASGSLYFLDNNCTFLSSNYMREYGNEVIDLFKMFKGSQNLIIDGHELPSSLADVIFVSQFKLLLLKIWLHGPPCLSLQTNWILNHSLPMILGEC